MKDIGILTHSFLDAYNGNIHKVYGGGLERYLYDLADCVAGMGCKPTIHQLSFCGAFHTEVDGIEVIGYDCPRPEDTVSVFNRMTSQAKGRLIYASFIWQPIDYKEGSLGICHGINWDHHAASIEHKQETARTVQRALQRLSRIVTVDSHFLSFCRSACSYADPDQIVLLPNAVDTDYFSPMQFWHKPTSDAVHILYPRRISIERGIVPMMLVADRLLEAFPQVQMHFAGEVIDNSLITKVFRLWLRDHPNRDRIAHLAYSFEEMAEAYRQADIAVIPTIFSEGTSYSCLEAQSCGLPVVAGNVGGLNDLIIDGFNGRLVTPTEEQLFQAIAELVEQRDTRHYLGANARATARAFDLHIWKRRWRSLLSEYVGTESGQTDPPEVRRKQRGTVTPAASDQ
ncbi:glycosyltransferase family 4 protein [Paenibacillus rigui]|uniref:Glycosyl transferase family 1 n=1 Tax=Paenibacillus rigui TaxID=554312 RepID=A0A229UNJ1_9BACL|nr:glycosyltransferase family 4 protein [Paenibacillus rigui]OXM85067.1 glycosyl transferase family 1 [Paenibacillus rigui]